MTKEEILANLWADFEFNHDQSSEDYDYTPLTHVRYKGINAIEEGRLVDDITGKVYRLILEEIPSSALPEDERKRAEEYGITLLPPKKFKP